MPLDNTTKKVLIGVGVAGALGLIGYLVLKPEEGEGKGEGEGEKKETITPPSGGEGGEGLTDTQKRAMAAMAEAAAKVKAALLDAAKAAIQKADAAWQAFQSDPNVPGLREASQAAGDAAYTAMLSAVRGDAIGSGALADAAKAVVSAADTAWQKWQTVLASNQAGEYGATQQDVDAAAKAVSAARQIAYDAMAAAIRTAGSSADHTVPFHGW